MEKFIAENRISISYFPPAYYEQGAFALDKYVITAGSQVGKGTIAKALAVSNYMNSYGPTEATVCATNWVAEKGSEVPDTVTIGKPIPWQTFDNTKTPNEWAQFVKEIVYKLNISQQA